MAVWLACASLPLVGGRTVVRRRRVGHPVFFAQPAAQINDPAPAGTERIVRVILPVPRHRRVTDRTPHLIHRFGPPRTSGFLHATGPTASLVLLAATALAAGLAVGFGLRGRRRFTLALG